MQLDLGPQHYLEKGAKPVKYVSSRPFQKAAVWCGIWEAGFYYTFRHWLTLDPPWMLLPIALAPGAILFLMSLLFLHEGTAEPPELPPSPKPPRPKREYPHWRVVPRE